MILINGLSLFGLWFLVCIVFDFPSYITVLSHQELLGVRKEQQIKTILSSLYNIILL